MEKPGNNGEAWSQSRSPQKKLWGIRQEARRRTGEMLSRAPEQGRTLQSSQVEVSDVIGSSGTLGGVRGQGTQLRGKASLAGASAKKENQDSESSQEAKRRTSKQKCYKRCRRDGSVVNNMYCSSRGAQGRKEFSIQYP